MPARIFRSSLEYVAHITELERNQNGTNLLLASSYVSSHLFPKSTLARYFNRDPTTSNTASDIVEKLWLRRKLIYRRLNTRQYYELYEIDALDALCNAGVIHRQDPRFLATRGEVRQVLEALSKLLAHHSLYHVAFCREVLPFVFITESQRSVTIDVRNNFGYQRIQGMWFEDVDLAAEFEAEFWRLWHDAATLSDRHIVQQVVAEKLQQLSRGSDLLALGE